jgi:hypothetical protein
MNELRAAACLMLAALAGCGSSGSTGDGSASDGGPGGRDGAGGGSTGHDAGADGAVSLATLTWKEDGIARTATSAIANRYSTTGADSLSVLGTDVPASATLSFVVSTGMTLGGTYNCGPPALGSTNTAALNYDNRPVPTTETCTIAVTFAPGPDGQPHVTGTFEATLPMEAGVTTLSEGRFDLPVSQN